MHLIVVHMPLVLIPRATGVISVVYLRGNSSCEVPRWTQLALLLRRHGLQLLEMTGWQGRLSRSIVVLGSLVDGMNRTLWASNT